LSPSHSQTEGIHFLFLQEYCKKNINIKNNVKPKKGKPVDITKVMNEDQSDV